MYSNKTTVFIIAALLVLATSCKEEVAKTEISSEGFSILSSAKSGITFSNNIVENETKNYFNFEYIYNGGGVAIGDINNDGLDDIYFSGNEVENKLYLNKGEMKFEDITTTAGVAVPQGWKTGVNMVDINQDGYLDIYVCRSGWDTMDPKLRTNLLFINNKDNTFKEFSKAVGLDEGGFSIHSSFFDYDKDGDLDLYVTNHPFIYDLSLDERIKKRTNPDEAARDKLYRNDGGLKFTEVAQSAGIYNYGHGLGIVTSDINKDGWTDIYIANDYKEPDYLYINNKDGTFTNQIKELTGHISFNSMGIDIGDINNDGLEDIFITEMLPSDYKRSKTNMASMNIKLFEGMKKLGLHYQYMHNVLLLNKGNKRYVDVSQITGTAKTDWSWSCNFIDFDNDGNRDLFITNGNKRDVFNRDYKIEANRIAKENGGKLNLDELYKIMPATKLSNFLFKNNGDLDFNDVTSSMGLDRLSLSQGSAISDLDNDGDIDIVVNNLDETSYIIENNAAGNYLRINLEGSAYNRRGLNSKVEIQYDNGKKQYYELKTTKGYLSCSESIIHFGLGDINVIDKVSVIWPDDKISTLTNVQANQVLNIKYSKAKASKPTKKESNTILKVLNVASTYKHSEKTFNDYKTQILLPHKFSQLGPFMSSGDINGDGMEDVFVGGASGQAGMFYLQQANGDFGELQPAALVADRAYEDMGSAIEDFDGDGDMDIFIASGSNEFPAKSPMYNDRLYLNDGKGNFTKKNNLPANISSSMDVSACDFDADGDMDIFVSGRIFPDYYPYPTPSLMLVNDGKANFTDVARTQGQGLDIQGMVTSSVWSDVDADGDKDLIVVGEWLPITIFENNNGTLSNATNKYNLQNTTGWWNKIVELDYDSDGDMDYIVGNLGLNHKFQASPEKPFHLYSGDYDDNGSIDVVLAKYYEDKEVPVRGKECSTEQMPFISEKFGTYKEFANAGVLDMLGESVDKGIKLSATIFQSIVLERTPSGFIIKELPRGVQLSPMNGIAHHDFDSDGRQDLIIAGNMYETEAETTRADASIGSVILNKESGFEVMDMESSGFYASGDVKDLIKIKSRNGHTFVVSQNNEKPLFFISN